MWNPVPDTWIEAINAGFFATWPGITADIVRKHYAKTIESAKGHMKADRKNVRSTKNDSAREMTTTPQVREYEYYVKTIELTGKLYSDQTGRFPVISSKGNKYIMIIYDHDSNAILARPLKTKSGHEQLKNLKEVHQYLNKRGIHPKIHVMDNECSQATKDYIIHTKKIDLLLVPPYMHRVNAAEKAIDTFKNHFIAGLASLDPQFPMHLWCRLLPLATTTLNLLRPSRVNPRLSAEEFLNGVFDYNKTPIAPPGCKVLVHETKSVRKNIVSLRYGTKTSTSLGYIF